MSGSIYWVQFSFSDSLLAEDQYNTRVLNHDSSARSKAPRGKPPAHNQFKIGDLVYIKNDKDKTSARSLYIVVSLGPFITLRKFVGSNIRSKIYSVRPSEIYPAPINA